MTIKTPVQLCSRCTVNEIASWVFENQLKLEPDTIKQIREELKDIKLSEGMCLVCSHPRVSENCFDNVLKVLEKSDAPKEVIADFKNFSGMNVLVL